MDWTAQVVDDGSCDTSPAIAEAWSRRDPRIQLLRPGRVGLPRALNLACKGSSPLVARLDGDDVCHPERLARQVAFLQSHPSVDVLDSRVECFRDDAPLPEGMARYQLWHDGIEEHEDFEREFLVENPVCHPAVVARRRALLPYRSGGFPEDYDLWLRMHRAGARFHKLPERLLRWRDRDSRATRTDPIYRRPAFFTLQWEHFQASVDLPGRRTAVWGAGARGRPWIRALAQAGHPPVAVIDIAPRLLGRSRQGVEIVSPEALAELDLDLVVAAVGRAGVRSKITQRAEALGIDCIAVAGLA